MSPQAAAAYLVKYVVDSIGTDLATSSGPHGISLSTTMDDDVFMDGTLREVEEKTPDSQDEVSERSMLKISPGAVRQEVSQAISDKKGTLIILKEAEDKDEGKQRSTVGEKEEPVIPGEAEDEEIEMSASKEKDTIEEDASAVTEAKTTVFKTPSPKMEIKTDDITQIKSIDSPKKAMASWISEEVKTEASEIISVLIKEEKEMKTSDALQQKAEIFTFAEEQSKSIQSPITVSESSTTSLAVVLYEKQKKATTWFWLLPLHISTTLSQTPYIAFPFSSSSSQNQSNNSVIERCAWLTVP